MVKRLLNIVFAGIIAFVGISSAQAAAGFGHADVCPAAHDVQQAFNKHHKGPINKDFDVLRGFKFDNAYSVRTNQKIHILNLPLNNIQAHDYPVFMPNKVVGCNYKAHHAGEEIVFQLRGPWVMNEHENKK